MVEKSKKVKFRTSKSYEKVKRPGTAQNSTIKSYSKGKAKRSFKLDHYPRNDSPLRLNVEPKERYTE